jgi:DNA-binding SARP family transcriptional activator
VAEPGELRVLGPVEAVGPGGRAELRGSRQRAILGALALHAGTVLSVERLIDLVWGEAPPRTAIKTVHSYVVRIRQALGACGFAPVLITGAGGYAIEVPPEVVDARLFERRVNAARLDIAVGNVERAATVLRSALALWRGDAFADTVLAGWGAREVDRLHELRLSALEDLWDAELRMGNHDAAVRELPRLLAAHPARERLAGLQMVALYRCGRHTEALDTFQRVRRLLASEFGVDPGPELVALNTSILRRDGKLDPHRRPSAPQQLPARVGHFAGRDVELESLDRLLDESGDGLPVVVIRGAAGIGKTALAVQWCHRIAGRFPDGNLFLDLRGHDPEQAVPVPDALAHLLHGLDVPDERLPGEPAERAALYRSLLHGKRCLILADNAAAVSDVLPLVPGAGDSLLVVTSRQTLTALGTRLAVHTVALDALDHTGSMALLSGVLGESRVRREPGPAGRLARLCGGMPLALRIVAAQLGGDPGRSLARAAAELTAGDRLDSLAIEGDARTVRTVFASAYLPLAAAQTRMFNRLGLSPGTTFSTWLASAMCGLPASEGRQVIGELAGTHLVGGAGEDRFRFHDLIREFARHCARTDESKAGRVEAGERLIDWYLAIASAANKVIDPSRDRVTPVLRHAAPEIPFATERPAALAFLGAERDNLLPVVRYARENGWLRAAWQLTYLLTSFYDTAGHWHERIELCRHGTAAATELGDPLAKAEMLRALGVAYFMTRRLRDALDTNRLALRAGPGGR